MKPVIHCLLVIAAILPVNVHAEPADDALTNSGPGAFFSGARDSLAVEVAKDQKTATMKLATWSLSGATRTSIEVQAPFDKDEKNADYANLDGLRGATAVTLGIDYRRIAPLDDAAGDAAHNKAVCKQFMLVSNNENCSAGLVHAEAKQVAGETRPYALRLICEKFGIDENACDANTFPDSMARQYALARQAVYGRSTRAWLVPIKLKYGLDTYKYQDAATLAAEEDKEYPASASIGLGYLNHRGFVGVGYEYQDAFKPQKTVSLCTPVPGQPGVNQCSDTILGAPAETKRENAFIETRLALPGRRTAMAVKVTKDVRHGEEAVEIPFYLLQTEKKGIHAGIRLDWSSLDNDVAASMFFGTGFSFYD